MANKAKTKQDTKTGHHRRQHKAGVLMSMETECLEKPLLTCMTHTYTYNLASSVVSEEGI